MSLWLGGGMLVAVALTTLLFHARREGTRWLAAGIAVALPMLTIALYLHLGAPDILAEQALLQAQAQHDPEAMVSALETKLKKEPNDADGWYALGRAHIAFQRHGEAEAALAKAAALAPNSARILAQYAEAIALNAGSLDGRPLQLVMAALEIDYEEEKALELAGLAAFQKEKWAEALHFWRRLLKRLPRDSEFHDTIEKAVKVAEQKAAAGR